jgi:hypothetical protein
MALTRKDYRWLAAEVSPLVQNKELFFTTVRRHAGKNFDQYKFRDAMEDAWADKQSEECGPDLYKLADYVATWQNTWGKER